MEWSDHQDWESNWWGDCLRTYGEEEKQIRYAGLMGLSVLRDNHSPYIDLQGKSVLDVGGGPVSLLLKCINRGPSVVIDPCQYPSWTIERYKASGINYFKQKGEEQLTYDCGPAYFDEVWMYNVLQHTDDPEQICKNCLHWGKIVRIFDWVNAGVGKGHPHDLKPDLLDTWLKGEGKITMYGQWQQYHGVFIGEHYGK